MKHKNTRMFLAALFLVGLSWACAKKPTAPEQIFESFPKPPVNLRAEVSDRKVTLYWVAQDSGNVQSFKVFRNTVDETTPVLVGTPDKMTFVDKGLTNGVEYVYRVSSVGQGQLESEQSEPIQAIPNIFSVLINNGGEFVNTSSVSLTLNAPTGTFVKLSNEPTFGDAQFEPVVATRDWLLSPGDGVKRVYAVFLDGVGNESSPVSDDIVLDTQAIIFSVSENTNGRLVVNGEVIHFTLNATEPDGNASVEIENGPTVPLFDNGTGGDRTAGDGLYERDYVVPFGVQTDRATVTGHFTDRAGNVAADLLAPGVVSIQTLPVAVTLLAPSSSDIGSSSVRLNWTLNSDGDFSEYRIYRATAAGVTLQSTLAGTVTDQLTTTFEDTGLESNREYFYRVYVFDGFGLSSG
ncbi:MAG: hypothetical protein D6743_01690, partial [Calditrichaeota bacterium]